MARRIPQPRIDLEAIRFALLAVGLLALMAGIALYLVQNDLSIPVRVALAVGIILLGAYVAIDPEDVWRRLSARGSLYGGNTLLMAAAGLGILALINVLAGRDPLHRRLDLTANRQFSLSEQSLQVVRNLPAAVHVTGFFTTDDRFQQDNADSLLKQYQAESNGKLTFEFVDPVQRPSVAQQFGIRQLGTVVFQMGDRRENATSVGEQEFTAALIKLVNPTPRKVYFTSGHGERDTNAVDERGYSSLVQLLERENFAVETVNLVTSGKVPDDASVVVIAAPTNQFQDNEKKAIQDYLDRGGSLMLLFETDTTPQVADFVSAWNVKLDFYPVIDPVSSLPEDPLAPLVQRYIFHSITKSLNGIYTVWPVTAALEFPRDQAEHVFTAPLVESSPGSWMETSLQQELNARRVAFTEGKDREGPITIAGVIEADAKQQPPADPNNPDRPPKKTRVVVIADSDFVANQWLRSQTANQDFFLNAMNWLTETEQLIALRPKEDDFRQMVLSGAEQNAVFLTTVVILPLLVLGAGAFVWWVRR